MTKSKIKTSLDGKCKFYEKKHKYKVGKRELVSVTTFLKKYFSEFDATKIANLKVMLSKRSCNLKGIPYNEECKVSFWKKKWKESAEHGSRVHGMVEAWVNNPNDTTILEGKDDKDVAKFGHAVNWLSEYLTALPSMKLVSEVIIYDEEMGLAGQIDDLCEIEYSDGAKVYDILDLKTNEKITTEGYRGKKAEPPINYMDDCSMSKYILQMCLYAFMLEKQGKKINELLLLHLTEDGVIGHRIDYKQHRETIVKLLEHSQQTSIL